jgi:hypothetical protein
MLSGPFLYLSPPGLSHFPPACRLSYPSSLHCVYRDLAAGSAERR